MNTTITFLNSTNALLAWMVLLPAFVVGQGAFRVPLPPAGGYMHVHAAEIERHLALPHLDSLARQGADPEEVWSMVSGFADMELAVRKTPFSWVPLLPSKTDTLRTAVNKVIRRRRRQEDFYAWHCFWMGRAWEHYDLSTIGRIQFLDYIVDPKTGANRNPLPTWPESDLLEKAAEQSVAVDLAVALHGTAAVITFLDNLKAQDALIANLLAQLGDPANPGRGINLDFYAPEADHQTSRRFSAFALKLHLKLVALNPDWQLSVTLPGSSVQGLYDFQSLRLFVPRYVLMGYGFQTLGQAVGPAAPWNVGDAGGGASLEKELLSLGNRGIPLEKVVLCLPRYGSAWESTSGKFRAWSSSDSIDLYPSAHFEALHAKEGKREAVSQSMYAIGPFLDAEGKPVKGRWSHNWWEDEQSLTKKFGLAQRMGLGGVGIWALGYDKGRGMRPEAIPLLLAAMEVAELPVAEDTVSIDTVENVDQQDSFPAVGVNPALVPGRPLSFIEGYDLQTIGQFFWVQVDSFRPLLPSTDEEYLFLSPDIAMPLAPIPEKMALWGLVFLGCFIELGLALPLFRFGHRLLIFVERPWLGFLQIPLLAAGALLLTSCFAGSLGWYWWLGGMLFAVAVAVFWRRSMADVL